MTTYKVSPLPLPGHIDLESRPILKKLASAHRYLAELKGVAGTIPNENILIDTLTLQEAKDSSAVENIITTHDEIFKTELFGDYIKSPAAKEVRHYAIALKRGFNRVRECKIIRLSDILDIQRELEQNRAGLRKLPGTELKNEQTQEVVYTPPQDHKEIQMLMANLVDYINDDTLSVEDPLIKMALVHFQFESIHPFYDGNGRTGRIINILYLVTKGLLDLPVLYLSRFITRNKADYYRCLQAVREQDAWQDWIFFMLAGVEETARRAIELIKHIKREMQTVKHRMREQLPKIYSQDLLNNLFRHPYTKIEFVQDDLQVTRLTATKYLDQLSENGFVKKAKIGRSNYYINGPLFRLFLDGSREGS